MTHEQLLLAFQLLYPAGCIYTVPGLSGAYDVQYAHAGKLYRYRATSRIALARRLGLDVAQYERDYSASYNDDTPLDTIAGISAERWERAR